jgi:type IV secretory pathway VirB10-like protein
MSGEAIITLIAVAVILVVFGIPLYVVRRRNRIQVEEPEQEQEQPSMEVTPVNDAGPQLTQEPSITSATIAVDPNPVPPVQPSRRRVEKKATVAPVVEKKSTRRSKPKTDIPSKALKKALKEVADMDKSKPVLSKEFASKHVLKLDEKTTKTTKKTTKSTKTAKKSATKSKKNK